MGYQSAVLPPVRCAALLSFVLARCTYPTTLVICSASSDFVRRCVYDEFEERDGSSGPLHTASLLEVAVARHIRVVFVPTVAHLRGFLAAFDLATSRVPAPPEVPVLDSTSESYSVNRGDRVLVVYDFVRLHRCTSEWSGQGLGASVAVLVEAGWRTGLDVLVVESGDPVEGETAERDTEQETVLNEKAPILSSAARKQMQRAGYPLRSGRVREVLERWLTLRQQLYGEDGQDVKVRPKNQEENIRADAMAGACGNEHISHDQPDGVEEARDKTAKSMEGAEETRLVTDDEEESDGVEIIETRPRRTFVKDSDEEDDGPLDSEANQEDSTI
ncbi:hypothetical protein SEPCBS57363_003917 [Sporothrix epigloea]|uniref:Uncharacterized protein n=1 Tax=Sporothrix epigloea TaxID=1892477 RepID=A0ABP0DQI1_9PEZI